ncbi:ribonuclease H-like domain, reverse transcriptase, RNA-dependent DNA polymerase [Tanacetum coccineum]|uniref:Ribonuclease H-like domain, reverse transcriptase, RNA-dependent DNA polymerase n=1 Tax=Tanacetum coccineum TaxID=301880 RepID=A0ABQ5BFG1_9ASTR
MEDCNATFYPTEKDLKLSKAEDEQEVEATQYQKVVGCLRYLLHTRPDLTYSVGVVSQYMQSPRESHARAIKQIICYLKGLQRQKVIIRVDNKSAIALSKSPVFHERSKHIHTRYHFIRECVENEQLLKDDNTTIVRVQVKIGVADCVYNIWRERNIRFFQDKKRSKDVIIREIIEDIKWKLSSVIVKRTQVVSKIYEDWDIKPTYKK